MAKRGARVKPLRTIPAKSLRMLKAFLIRAPSLIAYRPKNNPPDYFIGRFGFEPQVIIKKRKTERHPFLFMVGPEGLEPPTYPL